jgi:hypothetical protein
MNHGAVFETVYRCKMWGDNGEADYPGSSGHGSSIEYNSEYIPFLREFIIQHQVRSVVDMGCGDWRCGVITYGPLLPLKYTGYDVFQDIIDANNKKYPNDHWKFEKLNCCADPERMVAGDLLVIKDVLQHWTDFEITWTLKWLIASKKYKYILITNCIGDTNATLKQAGHWRGLSADHSLLKEFKPKTLLKYNSKEVMLITVDIESERPCPALPGVRR